MTEELYHLWYSIDEDVHELIAFSTEDLKAAQVAVISLFPMLILEILNITRGDENLKHIKCFTNTNTIRKIVDAMLAAATQF